jgi:hypothetical protein
VPNLWHLKRDSGPQLIREAGDIILFLIVKRQLERKNAQKFGVSKNANKFRAKYFHIKYATIVSFYSPLN